MAGRPNGKQAWPGRHPSGRRIRDVPVDERLRLRVEEVIRGLWHRNGQRATAARIASYLHKPDQADAIARCMVDPTTIANLRADGVLADEQPGAGATWPDSRQMNAVRAFCEQVDPDVATSFTEALASVGVTRREWNGWLRDPVFVAYFRDVAGYLFGDNALAMDAALLKQALSGDVAALKLAYTVTGRLSPENAVDPSVLVARVLEVLIRHIPDRGVLEDVAEELKGLAAATGAGRALSAPPVITEEGEKVAG